MNCRPHIIAFSPTLELFPLMMKCCASIEAMGILALLTRHTPKDIADERERLQELLEVHQQHSERAQQNMLGYVRELESRLAELPGEIEAGLDPKQIAKMLGESLRQHFSVLACRTR